MKVDLKVLLEGFRSRFRNENPHLPAEDLERLFSTVEAKIDEQDQLPPRIVLIGHTGTGKTSTVNSLFNAGAEISHTEACTQVESAHEIGVDTLKGERGVVVVYDMPGFGESRRTHTQHRKTYERVLESADVVLLVLDAQYRAMEDIQDHVLETVGKTNKKLLSKMVFGVNKVDLVYPGQTAWHPLSNLPSLEQEANINARVNNVRKLIKEEVKEWDGEVIPYSADRRYNLPQLFAAMLDAVPEKRRWVLASRKALAPFMALVHPELRADLEASQNRCSPIKRKKKCTQSVEEALNEISEEGFVKISENKETFLKWAQGLAGNRKEGYYE